MFSKLIKLLYLSIIGLNIVIIAMEPPKKATVLEDLPVELKSYILSLAQEGKSIKQILESLKILGLINTQFRDLIKNLVNSPEAIGNVARNYIEINPQEAYKEFLEAARTGDKSVLKALINGGIDVNFKDDRGLTALMHARGDGHNEIIKMLIDAGANINAQDKNGLSVIMHAAITGQAKTVEFLLQNGADPNLPNNFGQTTLTTAQYYYRLFRTRGILEVIDLLEKWRK